MMTFRKHTGGPIHRHNCDKCVYLETWVFTNPELHVDIYECELSILDHKMYRFSDEPSDYTTVYEQVIARFVQLQREKQKEDARIISWTSAMSEPWFRNLTPLVLPRGVFIYETTFVEVGFATPDRLDFDFQAGFFQKFPQILPEPILIIAEGNDIRFYFF